MGTFSAIKGLLSLPSVFRRLLLIGIDAHLLLLAVWLSFWLRLAHPFHPNFVASGSWLLLAVLLVGLPLYAFTGQYKGLTRYVGSQAFYRLAGRNGFLVLFLAVRIDFQGWSTSRPVHLPAHTTDSADYRPAFPSSTHQRAYYCS